MLSYKDFTKYFGSNLSDKNFQTFLAQTFSDLTEYDIQNHDYIISEDKGMELGFTNNDAIYDEDDNIVFEDGQPIFSHFNIYPKSANLIDNLPLRLDFSDTRVIVIQKADTPTQTNEGFSDLLSKRFLVDSYKTGEIVVSVDYNPDNQQINFIAVRNNKLVEHLIL